VRCASDFILKGQKSKTSDAVGSPQCVVTLVTVSANELLENYQRSSDANHVTAARMMTADAAILKTRDQVYKPDRMSHCDIQDQRLAGSRPSHS
jgi:hypothetical protein